MFCIFFDIFYSHYEKLPKSIIESYHNAVPVRRPTPSSRNSQISSGNNTDDGDISVPGPEWNDGKIVLVVLGGFVACVFILIFSSVCVGKWRDAQHSKAIRRAAAAAQKNTAELTNV